MPLYYSHVGGYQHFRGIYCLHLALISLHLKDEAVHSPEMLVPTYHNATYCRDQQKHNMNLHRLQNLRSSQEIHEQSQITSVCYLSTCHVCTCKFSNCVTTHFMTYISGNESAVLLIIHQKISWTCSFQFSTNKLKIQVKLWKFRPHLGFIQMMANVKVYVVVIRKV